MPSDYLSGPIYSHLNPKHAKISFLGVNQQKALKNGPLCTKHVQKIWFNTWKGLWDPFLLEFMESNLK